MTINTIKKGILTLLMLPFCLFAPEGAAAGTVSFADFTAGSGLAVEEAFRANAGSRLNPDTVTLRVADGATVVSFSLTVNGSGFSSGSFCELDWDDDAPGVPAESAAVLRSGSFSVEQVFNVPVSRLWAGGTSGTRTVLYELDVDEEPYDSSPDVERYLKVVFVSSSIENPGTPVDRTVSFNGFAAGSGLTVEETFRSNTGSRLDPDTVTLRVADGATTVSFRLTVNGGGFSSGSFCELDWDDDAPGIPAETITALSNGAFSAEQIFNVPVSRLWSGGASGTRTVLYELDVDEEPYDNSPDVERYLRVVFLKGSSTNPNPGNPGSDSGGGGGGGCSTGNWLYGLLLLLPMRARKA